MDQLLRSANQSKPNFVCGDFNINQLKQEKHVGTKCFLNCMYGLGLYPLIIIERPIQINSCTLIDNIFTNQINYSANSVLLIRDICTYTCRYLFYVNMNLKTNILRHLEMYGA